MKILYDISDRDLEIRANTDMAFKIFLDLEPDDAIPHASLLAKFRCQRISEDMLEEFLNQTIRQAVEKKLIKSTAIIVDSTHTKSKHSPQTPTQILREMSKEFRKEIYKTQCALSENFPQKPSLNDTIEEEIEYTRLLIKAIENSGELKSESAKKQLLKIKETLDLPNLTELQSGYEKDAKIGHKSKTDEFFGYKNHIAMTENEQLITALEITNGNAADTKSFENIANKTLENGIEITEIIGVPHTGILSNVSAALPKYDFFSRAKEAVGNAVNKTIGSLEDLSGARWSNDTRASAERTKQRNELTAKIATLKSKPNITTKDKIQIVKYQQEHDDIGVGSLLTSHAFDKYIGEQYPDSENATAGKSYYTKLAEDGHTRGKYGLKGAGKVTYDIAENVADMASDIGAASLMGVHPVSMTALTSAGKGFTNAKNDGKTETEALTYGVLSG
ncbi:MAG: transposase, partial [Oscillospiraceae bacterium]